jgi:hypothetical protein
MGVLTSLDDPRSGVAAFIDSSKQNTVGTIDLYPPTTQVATQCADEATTQPAGEDEELSKEETEVSNTEKALANVDKLVGSEGHFIRVDKDVLATVCSKTPYNSGLTYQLISEFGARLVAIYVSTDNPAKYNPYISAYYNGYYYYIRGDDGISQRNFMLIWQFLLIQAGPSAVAPLSPTLSIGAGATPGH